MTKKVLRTKDLEGIKMSRILVTGGTTFVSRFTAGFFRDAGHEVYVLNRNSKPQVEGVKLIEADRHDLGDALEGMSFDAVLDITAYTGNDVSDLLSVLHDHGTYILLSSSAVYPEDKEQPFVEECELGENKFWGKYGTDKIDAETVALKLEPDAYILRPPYLYGPMNNVYREAFVFDCAKDDRPFYLPREGEMKLQFFHVKDLCKIMEYIIDNKPQDHTINVGNPDPVSVREWVELCYSCLGKTPEFVNVREPIEQRQYFSFYDYEYALDVKKQMKILPEVTDLKEGLMECYNWYKDNGSEVRKKPLIEFIDDNLRK